MKTQKSIRVLAGGAATLAALSAGLLAAHAAPHAKISAARANAIVLKRFPGKLTQKTALENEEGKWQYSVNVRSGRTLREVMVDANTGKIADIEVTTAAKEGAENRKEAADAKAKAGDEKGEKETGAKESNEKGETKD